MLFHEIYGGYFNVAAEVIKEACNNTLSNKRLHEIIRAKAFDESVLEIPAALKNDWSLLTFDMKTPIKHPPTMPLTLLQKRWMKAILGDPRIKLFGVTDEGLDDVEPLYETDTFYYFDRYSDGDPYNDEGYIDRFRMIIRAIKEKRNIRICYAGRHGNQYNDIYFPWYLEYSSKDDKFRLCATIGKNSYKINLGRIVSAELLEQPDAIQTPPKNCVHTLTAEIINERNALERVMLHFSHLKKETMRLDNDRYHVTIHYDKDDETEMLIRILSFGPTMRVISPGSFITLIRERLAKQRDCGLT